MTAARQRAKAVTAILLAAATFALAGPGAAAPLVIDPGTGLALSGFDPVAYYTDNRAEPGRPDIELSADGSVWRFRNEGNRAAFKQHPDVYRPAFGGYDPVAIARARSVPGHPLFWAMYEERVYLFYSAESRAAFLERPAAILDAATRNWPQVEQSVAR